jgi:uncharacterized cupin superfamily protein
MTGRLGLLLSLAIPMVTFGLAPSGHAAELDPAAVAYRTPDQFKWRDPANKGPSNNVILHGDPSKTGFYVQLQRWNKGNFSGPHFHPNDRFMYIFSGTWWNGTGTTLDPDNSVPLRAGTSVSHFGMGVHWDGAKDDDAIFVIVGMGPGTATQLKSTPGKFTGLNPSAVAYKPADQFTWRDPSDASPTNQTILQGDPSKPGVYVQIDKFKPNNGSRPHFHPNDRFIFVLKGTWWVGSGTKYDASSMVAMPAGTFVTQFGKKARYDGARDEEVVVLVVGEGPSTSTQVKQD